MHQLQYHTDFVVQHGHVHGYIPLDNQMLKMSNHMHNDSSAYGNNILL